MVLLIRESIWIDIVLMGITSGEGRQTGDQQKKGDCNRNYETNPECGCRQERHDYYLLIMKIP